MEVAAAADYLGWFEGSGAVVHDEHDFQELVSYLIYYSSLSEIRSCSGMQMICVLFEAFFHGNFSSLVLTKFPEEAVRAVVLCADPALLLQIHRENQGRDVLPWTEYLSMRFPNYRKFNLELRPDTLTSCSIFYYLLAQGLRRRDANGSAQDANEGVGHLEQKVKRPVFSFKERIEKEDLDVNRSHRQKLLTAKQSQNQEAAAVYSGLGERMLMWMHSASSPATTSIPPTSSVNALSNTAYRFTSNKEVVKCINPAFQWKRSSAGKSGMGKMMSLKALAMRKICEHGLDFSELPKAIVTDVVMTVRREVDFRKLDLSKCSMGFIRVVISRMPKEKLLAIPKKFRGAERIDWEMLYRLRFGRDEDHAEDKRALYNVLPPCERFYARLLQCNLFS